MLLWSDSGLSGRNSYVEPRCRSPMNGVPSSAIQDRQDATVRLIRGIVLWHASGSLNAPIKRELGGTVYSNIVDQSRLCTGPPPPSPPPPLPPPTSCALSALFPSGRSTS
eukprot:7202582-Pyramimonas_sp.AAC.1